MEEEIVLTDNNFEDFIDNIILYENKSLLLIKNYIEELIKQKNYLKQEVKSCIDDIKDLEYKNRKLKSDNQHLEYYNDMYSKEYESMLKLGYDETLIDSMKNELLKENWHKFSLEQLENFIKTL